MGTKKGEIIIGNWVAIDKNRNNRKKRPNLRLGKTTPSLATEPCPDTTRR